MVSAVEDRLAEIEALADAATEGPWENYDPGDGYGRLYAGPDPEEAIRLAPCESCGGSAVPSPPDAAFIAAARTDVPALVAALRAVLEILHALPEHESWCHSVVCADHLADCDCSRGRINAAIARKLTP